MYYSLLDAMLDATYFAMDKLDSLSGRQAKPAGRVYVPESGWSSGGRRRHGGKLGLEAGYGCQTASVANAQAYNNNLINRVVSGKTGTPYRPDADMDVHIFALFNENRKGDGPDDVEANFGLFYPNQTKVYEFDFRQSWCVANASVGDARLQAALDYACGHGADCGAIQPGEACFEPNTRVAHASYAFNSYYHRKGRAKGACDFAGAAYVVYQAPKFGNCVLPSKAWIQETIAKQSEGYAAI